MAYFKINNIDFSNYVSGLKINKTAAYNAQTNAAGNTVVDYINSKREVEVTIIPLSDTTIINSILSQLDGFSVTISYNNPKTNTLESISCFCGECEVDYYTIQAAHTQLKEFNIKFKEL